MLVCWLRRKKNSAASADVVTMGDVFLGSAIQRGWDHATELGLRDLLPRLTPYAGDLVFTASPSALSTSCSTARCGNPSRKLRVKSEYM